jgi:CRP-like cAMP-binding protein
MHQREGKYSFADNRILCRLQRDDYGRLRALSEPVRLPQGRLLFETGDAVRHVYFVTGGMLSLLAVTDDDDTVQVAVAGCEGAVGLPALFGINIMPYRVVVQLPASALRISLSVVRAEFSRGGQLHDAILHYLHTLITQITQSLLCSRYHTIEQRLRARG